MRIGFVLILAIGLAQRIISRTQIEVKGYSVEKVGMPYSLTPAGKERFAYIEYWAQDKPKPGWYIECLNTQYYTQWSQLLDIPKAGEGRRLRLIGLKESLVALSYDDDPLTRGVTQEVARFYDSKTGQPLLPKWTAISVYDRPIPAVESGIRLSPDSTHFLWYAYQPGKKEGVERAWYAVWNQSARKIIGSSDWTMRGVPLAIAIDNRLTIWSVERTPNRAPVIVQYDTRARTSREWKIPIDTALFMPQILCTARGVYVAGFLSGQKTIPHMEAPMGRWAVGYMPFPIADTSEFRWGVAELPADWYALYREPTAFTIREILSVGDTAVYLLWEDLRLRSGTVLAYDVWVVRWQKVEDTPTYHWAYRIEKRQKEPDLRMVSYLRGIGQTFFTLAFLTERTGRGKLLAYQINHQTGEALTKELATNAAGDYLLLPGEAAYLGPQEVICFALAPPAKNGYQIYHIKL